MSKRIAYPPRTEKNRKQRKQRWMNAKNQMRQYPDCAYNGDFYCNHVFDPKRPWVWVDFRFFHTRLKRYFAVAMTTAEYEAHNIAEEMAHDAAKFPAYRAFEFFKSEIHPTLGQLYSVVLNTTDEYYIQYAEASERKKQLLKQFLQQPMVITPKIETRDYGPVAVGVFAIVNKQYIDEHVIREFIAQYRQLGEPVTPGWKWQGEPIEIIPQVLNDRYTE